ncbi:MAG: cytochrome c oxidase subunit 3 [Crocinitomicaceae bacterium]
MAEKIDDSTTDNKQLLAQEKIKKNLLWFGLFSIIMLFAGLTSGYIVAKGSSFWVSVSLPTYFVWSCLLVIISSILLVFAVRFVKRNQTTWATILIACSLVLGVFFGITQYRGFISLSESGNNITGKIINLEGRYGEYFTLYKNGKEISFDGKHFFWQGTEVSEAFLAEIKDFLSPLLSIRTENPEELINYGVYSLKLNDEALVYQNGRLEIEDLSLSPVQKSRLWHFAEAIIKNRGDFYIIGEYGKDFTVFYKGQAIDYENRKFYKNGQEISAYIYSELSASSNRASSFIIAFVFVHALHWIAGIIVLIVLTVNAGRQKYKAEQYTGLKIGSIYWHFLGILWLYLYLFLNFIH